MILLINFFKNKITSKTKDERFDLALGWLYVEFNQNEDRYEELVDKIAQQLLAIVVPEVGKLLSFCFCIKEKNFKKIVRLDDVEPVDVDADDHEEDGAQGVEEDEDNEEGQIDSKSPFDVDEKLIDDIAASLARFLVELPALPGMIIFSFVFLSLCSQIFFYFIVLFEFLFVCFI